MAIEKKRYLLKDVFIEFTVSIWKRSSLQFNWIKWILADTDKVDSSAEYRIWFSWIKYNWYSFKSTQKNNWILSKKNEFNIKYQIIVEQKLNQDID